MNQERITIDGIPAIVWGMPSERAYLFAHGKMSSKEAAAGFAEAAQSKGFQTVSFDLPEHGERKGELYACTAENGVRDLATVTRYVDGRWKSVNLYACSLGAYFSLVAFQGRAFGKCLLQSPVLDMERLIQNMMGWFGVTEADLARRLEIPTPMGETLSWDYYTYVRNHPIRDWPSPTSIIWGELDNLTERSVVDSFVRRFGCALEMVPGAEHPLMRPSDAAAVSRWIDENA
jgi:hypothetical protein